jgi:hypothetical protein
MSSDDTSSTGDVHYKLTDMAEWTDHSREDLRMIPKMQAAGWKELFSAQDIYKNLTSPDEVPHDAVSFRKGILTAWVCRNGWQVADVIKGSYTNHRGQVGYRKGTLSDKFPETSGYIPDLETLLQLDAAGEL